MKKNKLLSTMLSFLLVITSVPIGRTGIVHATPVHSDDDSTPSIEHTTNLIPSDNPIFVYET